jgi:hypothetical protein
MSIKSIVFHIDQSVRFPLRTGNVGGVMYEQPEFL